MNYGLLIERISELSGLPVSRIMSMDNNTLVNTVNDIFKEREDELTEKDGALYWINDWLNGSSEHEPHKPEPGDENMPLKDVNLWKESALDSGALGKLNDWLKKENLYQIDGDTTYKEWDQYFNDVIKKKVSNDRSVVDNAYSEIDNCLAELSREPEMGGEEALEYYSGVLTPEQKNDMTFKEASEELEKQINADLKKEEEKMVLADSIIDGAKDSVLYQKREEFLNSVVPDSSRLNALESKLSDEEKEKLDSLKNDDGKITYGDLEKFKKTTLNQSLASSLNAKHDFLRAFNAVNMKAPEAWDEKFQAFDDARNNENSEDNENVEDNTNENKSGKFKWLAGAAGVVAGLGVSLTPALVGAGAIAVGTIVAAKTIDRGLDVIDNFITNSNAKKGNWAKNPDGSDKVDENGNKVPAPSWVANIREKAPWLDKAVKAIAGRTNNKSWNWAVNGFVGGYAAGTAGKALYEQFAPKPPQNNITAPSITGTQPHINPSQPTNTVDAGSHWNLSNIDKVYNSSDMASGPLKPLDGYYNDAVVRRVLDTPNGRMVDFMSPDGEDLAWVAEEAIKSAGRKI